MRKFLVHLSFIFLSLLCTAACNKIQTQLEDNTKSLSLATQEIKRTDCSNWRSKLSTYYETQSSSDKPNISIEEVSFFSAVDGMQVNVKRDGQKLSSVYLVPNNNDFVTSFNLILNRCQGNKVKECDLQGFIDYYGTEVFFKTFLLSKAFPEGPAIASKEKISREVKELNNTERIGFRGLSMEIKPPWNAKVSIQRINENVVTFEIDYDSDGKKPSLIYKGKWSNKPISKLPAISDNLEDWEISTKVDKKILNQNPKTVGDLRKLML